MTRIAAVGHALPDRRVTSAELEVQLGVEPGWIVRRTGILERRYAATDQATSDLAVQAGQMALQQAEQLDAPIGLLLLATSTPDHLLPPTAPLVAHGLDLRGCAAIDLANACTGFLAAFALGHSYCQVQRCSVLIIASNVLSRRIHPQDPATAALFSDGAGALILTPIHTGTDCLKAIHTDVDGSQYHQIVIPAGGSRKPITHEALDAGENYMQVTRGPEVYRSAVLAMTRTGKAALKRAALTVSEIDWWIPHHANARIIRDVGERLEIQPDRTISYIETLGNTSAASIPLALSMAHQQGQLQPGQRLLLTAVGAGITEAAAVVTW